MLLRSLASLSEEELALRFVCGCTVRRDRKASVPLGFLFSTRTVLSPAPANQGQKRAILNTIEPTLGGSGSIMRPFFTRHLHRRSYQSFEPEPLPHTLKSDSPPTPSMEPPHASKLAQSPKPSFRPRLTRRFRAPRRSHPFRDACIICTPRPSFSADSALEGISG